MSTGHPTSIASQSNVPGPTIKGYWVSPRETVTRNES